MHAALQVGVGPEMQHVGRVHDDTARDVPDGFPTPVAGLQLQASDRLGEDEGDAAEVRVAADEDVFVFFVQLGGAGVVFDVAGEGRAAFFVLVVVDEELFGDFQDVGEEAQHAMGDILVEVAVELFDLGVVILDDFGMGPLVLFDELEYMIALPVVAEAGVLFDHSKGSVAIVVSILQIGAILQLLLLGQIEYLFPDGELSVNVCLGEAKVDHVEEACW